MPFGDQDDKANTSQLSEVAWLIKDHSGELLLTVGKDDDRLRLKGLEGE